MKAIVGAMSNGFLAKLSITVLGSLVILGITAAFLAWGELREGTATTRLLAEAVKSNQERILYLERQANRREDQP